MDSELEKKIKYVDKYKQEKGTEMVVASHLGYYETWPVKVYDEYATKDYTTVYRTDGEH